MNLAHMEHVWELVQSIRAEIETDTEGSRELIDKLGELETLVIGELKDLVWKRYLEGPSR